MRGRGIGLLVVVVALVAGCALLGPGGSDKQRVVVSNARCHVCHMNYDGEPLAVVHARNGIGCEKCHGPSHAHCADEANLTPPDILYPRDGINASCMKCHPAAGLVGKTIHKRYLEGDPLRPKACSDCHGDHRLLRRSVRWDKRTRKLLPEKDSGG